MYKTPDRNAEENLVPRKRAGKLYKLLCKKKTCIIMDDETYVKLNFKTMPGHHFYMGDCKKKR